MPMTQKKTKEEIQCELYLINPELEMIGNYINSQTPIKILNKKCHHEYDMLMGNIRKGCKCPICSGRHVLRGFNDIATTAPWMISYFVKEDDAYTHTCYSHDKSDFICPCCQHIQNRQIKSIYTQGFSCEICSDNISYPNKFMRSLLLQLPVQSIHFEYSPDWIGNKKYDGFFIYRNHQYVVEMDGMFHYENRISSKSLNDMQKSDTYKNIIAKKHNCTVIRIDAKESKAEYLIKNIQISLLGSLFDLSEINWLKCSQDACKNYIKVFAEYYNKHKFQQSPQNMADFYHISLRVLYSYIRKAKELGWIKETKQESSLVRSLHTNNPISSKVFVYDTNFNELFSFNSMLSCAKYLTNISNERFCSNIISRRIRNNSYKPYKNYIFSNEEIKHK